jgi:MFS family permease
MTERRVGWTTETLLLGSGVFGNVAMSTLSPALPKIEAHFANVPDADYLTKLTISAVGLGVILISPFTGTLVRLLGRNRVLAGAYAALVIFGLAGMFLPTLPLIIASRFFAGGAGAVIVAMGLILIGDFYEGRPRERRMGASHAIGALLLAGLMPIAGFLADINWRLAFLVHLVALPMLLFALMSPDLRKNHRAEAARAAATSTRSFRPSRMVVLFMVLTLLAGGIAYSVQIFVPFHLKGIGANSAGLAGTMLGVSVLASVTTSFAYAEIRRWLSVPMVFVLVFIGWSAGLATVAATVTVTGTLIGMAAIGLAGGLVGPNIFTAVSALTADTERAHSVGIVKGVYYFGPFFGPTMLQILSLHDHPETALSALAIFSAGLAVVCLVAAPIARSMGRTSAARTQAAMAAALVAELKADRA